MYLSHEAIVFIYYFCQIKLLVPLQY